MSSRPRTAPAATNAATTFCPVSTDLLPYFQRALALRRATCRSALGSQTDPQPSSQVSDHGLNAHVRPRPVYRIHPAK